MAWMDPENIMLSEISQVEKNNNYMISLMRGIYNRKQQTSKFIDTDNSRVVCRNEGGEARMKRVKQVNYMMLKGD